jgi:nitrogen fixation NifU-like protein
MIYNELILDYFFHPYHVGILNGNNVIQAQIKDMNLYIELDINNKIIKACFKSRANPFKIAGLEWLCRELEGDLITNHPRIDYKQIARVLDIPALKYADAIALEGIYQRLVMAAINKG